MDPYETFLFVSCYCCFRFVIPFVSLVFGGRTDMESGLERENGTKFMVDSMEWKGFWENVYPCLVRVDRC